jgi:hypothetical protein
VFLAADSLGAVGQHDRDVPGDGVTSPQSRVVQRPLVLEVEQAALVDWADQDLEQGIFQGHR